MRFQTAKVEVDQAGDEFVDVLPEEELEIGLAEAVTLTASDIGIESGQAVKSTTVEGIKVSKRVFMASKKSSGPTNSNVSFAIQSAWLRYDDLNGFLGYVRWKIPIHL